MFLGFVKCQMDENLALKNMIQEFLQDFTKINSQFRNIRASAIKQIISQIFACKT